jgi:hypothetical protein
VSTVDYAAGLIGWPLFLLGLALIAGGVFGLAWIFRDQLGYDEPEIPPVIEPDPDRTVILSAVRPAPNYHRDDTQVIPGIPGALPPRHAPTIATLSAASPDQWVAQEDWINAIDSAADATEAVTQAIPGLRVIPSAALWPEEPKSAPTDEPTQVVDLCPLTTRELPKLDEATPAFDTTVRRADTQELSAAMAKILERERVA